MATTCKIVATADEQLDASAVLKKALKRAGQGGLAGFIYDSYYRINLFNFINCRRRCNGN